MHDDTEEGRATAARTLASWALYGARTESPRKVFRPDWKEIACNFAFFLFGAIVLAYAIANGY